MLEAVLFDVDGVLVDSYRAHFRSWQEVASEHGLALTEERFAATFGRTSRDIIASTWGERISEDEIAAIDARKEERYRALIAGVPAMAGAATLVQALHREEIPMAVASSGPPENVALALARLGVQELFGAIVTGQDIARGKPDPQVFQIAAERLGAAPQHTVVIEDAPAGILAATRAGMRSVALLSTGHAIDDFRDVRPDRIVRTLAELSPADLRQIAGRAR